MKNPILLISLLISVHALAGGGSDVGNGGDVVVCRGTQGEIQSVEMLDLYEWRKTTGLTVRAFPGLDENLVFSQVSELVRGFVLEIGDELNYLKIKFDNDNIKAEGISLVDIPDSMNIIVPQTCAIEQIAIQKPPQLPWEKYYTINKTLWDHMDATNKAALIMHEIVFKKAIANGHQNSISVRKMVGYLFSDLILTHKVTAFIDVIRTLRIWSNDPKRMRIKNVEFLMDLNKSSSLDNLEKNRVEPGVIVKLLPEHFLIQQKFVNPDFMGLSFLVPQDIVSHRYLKKLDDLKSIYLGLPTVLQAPEYFGKCIVSSPVPNSKGEVVVNPEFILEVGISNNFLNEVALYDQNGEINLTDNYSITLTSNTEVFDTCNGVRGILKIESRFTSSNNALPNSKKWIISFDKANADYEMYVSRQFGASFKYDSIISRSTPIIVVDPENGAARLTGVSIVSTKIQDIVFQGRNVRVGPGAFFIVDTYEDKDHYSLKFFQGNMIAPAILKIRAFGNMVDVPFKTASIYTSIYSGSGEELVHDGAIGPVDPNIGVVIPLSKTLSIKVINEPMYGFAKQGDNYPSLQNVKLAPKSKIPISIRYVKVNEVSVDGAAGKIFLPSYNEPLNSSFFEFPEVKTTEPMKISFHSGFEKLWDISVEAGTTLTNGQLPKSYWVIGDSDYNLDYSGDLPTDNSFKFKKGYRGNIFKTVVQHQGYHPTESELINIFITGSLVENAKLYCRDGNSYDFYMASAEKASVSIAVFDETNNDELYSTKNMQFIVYRPSSSLDGFYKFEQTKTFRNGEVRNFSSYCEDIQKSSGFGSSP